MLDTIRIEPLKKSAEVVSLQRNSARFRDNIYTVSYILIWNRHMKIQFIYNQIYYCLEEMAFSHFILIRSCQGKKSTKNLQIIFFTSYRRLLNGGKQLHKVSLTAEMLQTSKS